jgi:hypothetical protein
MTDQLPKGWTQEAACFTTNHLSRFSNGEFVFYSLSKREAIRIARALSGPTIEDAKAAILKEINQQFEERLYGHEGSSEFEEGLEHALALLKDLAPTPAPDLTRNTTPFGLLPKKTQAALEALPKGALQVWIGDLWIAKLQSVFSNIHAYRQNPDWTPEPLTKPAVPWDVLADEIINAVKVATGPNEWTIYGCLGIPTWNEERQTWMSSNSCRMLPMSEIMSIDPGTCHPRDSLVQRPKEDK